MWLSFVSLTARIVIIATGPGGSTSYSHNIQHP
jgi:hypothetical protein